MPLIPDDKVKEVAERASILEVVGDYVSLRKAGANYQGLCPFHGEKTPSFNVNPARGIFHCFGCGVGGNAFSFIMKMEGLSFPEAVKFVAKKVGVVIEERPLTSGEKRRLDERESLYRINELAGEFYRRVLTEDAAGEPGRRYLARRGVDGATADAYRLGFAPEKWDALTGYLEKKRVPLELAEKLGVIRRRSGGGYHDLFRNRLIFVIADPQGRTIGFGGRVLDDSLPKYINSPESPIYHKSEVLFGINLAKQAMREAGTAIIVEGYFDHLSLYQAGVRNVVATCGTAMTDGHVKLLQRYAGKLYTLFDSDNAGKKATFRAMELVLGENLPVSVVELPAGEDPDSWVKKEGGEAFAARLAKARPIFEYYFRDLIKTQDMGSVEGKRAVLGELIRRLKQIGDRLQRNLYISEIARVVGIDEGDLRREVGLDQRPQPAAVAGKERKRGGVGTEEMLLALMGKYPDVARKVGEYGAANLFKADLLPVAEAILAQVLAGEEVGWPQLLEQVASPEERSRLAALFLQDDHLEEMDAHKAFEECRVSREKALLAETKDLKRELAQLDSDAERYWEILKKLDILRNKKSQLI